ncbi:hypothetical protein N7519_006415 [Penicillium mononematosum]|uniref:uncharacterized protein n=1 Tax=Penicillium mononematosum TaxID=268346 RepID=UPI0025467A4F|nr:uncharacterized protein N7519_006415 [Penicillium mononematosum]KAJ6185114.1 hypothetical protein N7519_006415 [Penicillium mononematosum]
MKTNPSTIPSNAYTGTIDGVGVSWGENAANNLLSNANNYNVDRDLLKGITETVAAGCANRIGKKSVKILGSFHDTTTSRATGTIRQDLCHCSIALYPGGTKAHIYVTSLKVVPIEEMIVVGESVVQKGKKVRDPVLSTGSLPPILNEE